MRWLRSRPSNGLKPRCLKAQRKSAHPICWIAAMLEESIAFCGGRETDVRRTLEQTAKRLGFTYEALMKGAADGTAVGRVVAQVKREHPAIAQRDCRTKAQIVPEDLKFEKR